MSASLSCTRISISMLIDVVHGPLSNKLTAGGADTGGANGKLPGMNGSVSTGSQLFFSMQLVQASTGSAGMSGGAGSGTVSFSDLPARPINPFPEPLSVG